MDAFRTHPEVQEREENVAPELERAEDAITEARREVRAPCRTACPGLPHCVRWPCRCTALCDESNCKRATAVGSGGGSHACRLPCMPAEHWQSHPPVWNSSPTAASAARQVGKLKKRIDEIMDRSFAAFSK